jgi:F-type H+-transporting ATPase subunit c
MRKAWTVENERRKQQTMIDILPVIAEATAATNGVSGSITLGLAGMGAAIGIGLTGAKAAEAVGRNPGAFGKVLTIGIIGMALSEAVAIYALIMAFQKY